MKTYETTPDIVIPGAPKAGTNALFSHLSAHPGVRPSSEKEPHLFSTDLPGLSKVPGDAAYRELFEPNPTGALTMEASVWYLFSQDAVPAIERTGPHTRYVVALRNPADVAVSLHGQFVRTLQEDQESFDRAWALQDERKLGRSRPRYCPAPELLQYRDAVSLGAQVERLLACVDADRVYFADYQRLASDPRGLYVDLLEFLGLPDDGRDDFELVNPSRVWRSQFVAKRLRNPSRAEGVVIDRVKSMLNGRGVRPLALLRPVLTREGRRPVVDEDTLRSIESELQNDMRRLLDQTGVDVSRRVSI